MQAINLLTKCILSQKEANTKQKQRAALMLELAKHKRDQSEKLFQNGEQKQASLLTRDAVAVSYLRVYRIRKYSIQ